MRTHLFITACLTGIVCLSCEKVRLPEVKTISFEIITLDSVLVTGEVTNEYGSPVTKRGFCWGNHPNPTLLDRSSENQTGPGLFTHKIGPIIYDQEYFFRSYASNANGFQYGNVLSFRISPNTEKGTITDSRDGKKYLTVTIGNQTWLAENLAYLPAVSPSWIESDRSPLYYVYGYEGESKEEARILDNFSVHGVLYNWPAAKTACPEGWHLPTDDEWTALTVYLGSGPGGKLKETGQDHWKYNSPGASNLSGFTARGSGLRIYHVDYYYLNGYAYFWSATASADNEAWYRRLNDINDNVFRTDDLMRLGQSVRCIKD